MSSIFSHPSVHSSVLHGWPLHLTITDLGITVQQFCFVLFFFHWLYSSHCTFQNLWCIYSATGILNVLISIAYFFSTTPSPLTNTCLFPVSMTLSCEWFWFLDSTYKWNHVVSAFLWLISLSIPSDPLMLLERERFYSFLWPGNIPLYVRCVCVSFFPIHLSIDS